MDFFRAHGLRHPSRPGSAEKFMMRMVDVDTGGVLGCKTIRALSKQHISKITG